MEYKIQYRYLALIIMVCYTFFSANSALAKIAQVKTWAPGVKLGVDLNRDGRIEFTEFLYKSNKRTDKVTKNNPFVLWINSDDDFEFTETKGDDVTDSFNPDYEDDLIDGTRDLIDFFAIGIKLKSFLTNMPKSDKYKYQLSQSDNAINAVFTVMGVNNSNDYLKKLNVQNTKIIFGNWQASNAFNSVSVFKITDSGVEIPSEFIASIKNGTDEGVFLIEARKNTNFPLVFTITDESNIEILRRELPLRSVDVEELYLQVSLRDNNGDASSRKWATLKGTLTGLIKGTLKGPVGIPAIVDQWKAHTVVLQPKISDIVDTSRHLIHLHGFNNDVDAARAFQSETFKRLYHSGSNVLFTAVHWRGNEGLINSFGAGTNYWGNVENAFNVADDLADFVNLIKGNKTILGHSLANMAIGSAISDFDMNVNNYFMVDPAVALEAYDADQLEVKNMRHTDWNEFYFGPDYGSIDPNYKNLDGRRLWASEWFSLFPDSDERSKLTWRGRFKSIFSRTTVVQYYSTGEEVLKKAKAGVPSSLEPVVGLIPIINIIANKAVGENAWNIVEKTKGTSRLAAILAGRSAAGWGFGEIPGCDEDFDDVEDCSTRFLSHQKAEAIKASDLKTDPFFRPFRNEDIVDVIVGSKA
ncbi:hypothetical protein MNBD_GAMMA08-13, partial [hydrothermal vent metagenome]